MLNMPLDEAVLVSAFKGQVEKAGAFGSSSRDRPQPKSPPAFRANVVAVAFLISRLQHLLQNCNPPPILGEFGEHVHGRADSERRRTGLLT